MTDCDPNKIEELYQQFQREYRNFTCTGPDCWHCKLMAVLRTPSLDSIVQHNIEFSVRHNGVEATQFMAMIQIGFILAWRYRDVLALEELVKQ